MRCISDSRLTPEYAFHVKGVHRKCIDNTTYGTLAKIQVESTSILETFLCQRSNFSRKTFSFGTNHESVTFISFVIFRYLVLKTIA